MQAPFSGWRNAVTCARVVCFVSVVVFACTCGRIGVCGQPRTGESVLRVSWAGLGE